MARALVFNPLTGSFDLVDVTDDHHACWNEILIGETVVISERKQMRVSGVLDNTGTLVNNGTLVLD